MAEIGALAGVGRSFDFCKAHHDPGYPKVRSALSTVANFVGKSEVVLFVFAVRGDRNNVVDFEHVPLERKVDGFLAEEAGGALPRQETLFQLLALSELEF